MINSRLNFDLTRSNTFAMPVVCRNFVEYDKAEDLPAILNELPDDEPVMHIGSGSNLLFTRDYPGTVLHSRIHDIELNECGNDSVIVKAGAGVVMDDLISDLCLDRYWGLENLSGIPGEVGASAVQNVGAYGCEAADAIVSVGVYDRKDKIFRQLDVNECAYAYRDSIFKHSPAKERFIITDVTYKLSEAYSPNLKYRALAEKFPEDMPESPLEVRLAVIEIRNSKLPDPTKVPSAGSFFKNPEVEPALFEKIAAKEGGKDNVPHYLLADGRVKIPAAWLIDRCGWKGRSLRNAAVWHLQPLVITNPGFNAVPGEILALEKAIADSVFDRFAIRLTPEVEHI